MLSWNLAWTAGRKQKTLITTRNRLSIRGQLGGNKRHSQQPEIVCQFVDSWEETQDTHRNQRSSIIKTCAAGTGNIGHSPRIRLQIIKAGRQLIKGNLASKSRSWKHQKFTNYIYYSESY